MPSFTTAKLPKPKSWDEFEDLVADVIKKDWKDPFSSRVGRLGQKQNGVDIYGLLRELNGEKYGIQCKNEKTISIKEIGTSILEAENFSPTLDLFILATSSFRDSKIQKKVWEISEKRKSENKFEVQILFWEDLSLMISGHYDLMQKHFPQFISIPSSWEKIKEVILNSTSKDWLFEDTEGIYAYKYDTHLTIRRSSYEEDEKFEEEWVKHLGIHEGYTSHHHIYYGNSFIKKIYMVAVDGYRAYIPYPDVNMEISVFQYKFGRIVNDAYNYPEQFGMNWFDNYLKRCKISIKEKSENEFK